MRPVISGVVVGVLVCFGLLLAFATGTGPIELLLWLLIRVLSGVGVTKLLRLGSHPRRKRQIPPAKAWLGR